MNDKYARHFKCTCAERAAKASLRSDVLWSCKANSRSNSTEFSNFWVPTKLGYRCMWGWSRLLFYFLRYHECSQLCTNSAIHSKLCTRCFPTYSPRIRQAHLVNLCTLPSKMVLSAVTRNRDNRFSVICAALRVKKSPEYLAILENLSA